MKFFGEHLRDTRKQRNLPLRKVAAILDIDTSVLSKIERGERLASIDIVIRLASYFELDREKFVADFFSDQIAWIIYPLESREEILKMAQKKAEFLRQKLNTQGSLKFNDEEGI